MRPVEIDWSELLIRSQFRSGGARLQWQPQQLRVGGQIRPGLVYNAPEWIKCQIEPAIRARGGNRVRLKSKLRNEWLDAFVLAEPLDADLRGLLELLSEILSIGHKAEAVEHCFALDYYKIPEDDVDPMQWRNTDAGRLVNQSKYSGGMSAFKHLTAELVGVVERHPELRACTSVVSVPGRDGTRAGHGERLARAVALGTGKNFYRTKPLYQVRAEAKSGGELCLEDVEVDSAVFFDDLTLIIDDVYRSGGSLGTVAAKARQVGAVKVYGLVGAKTLRN
jgi:hypothetical protein